MIDNLEDKSNKKFPSGDEIASLIENKLNNNYDHMYINNTIKCCDLLIQNILNNTNININQVVIRYKNKYKFKIIIENSKIIFKDGEINTSFKKLNFYFTQNNYFDFENTKIIVTQDKLDIRIISVSIFIEPIILYFIEKFFKFYLNKDANSSKTYNINLYIDFINISFLNLFTNIIELIYCDETLSIEKISCYDKDNIYLSLESLSNNKDRFFLKYIKIIITDKLVYFLDQIYIAFKNNRCKNNNLINNKKSDKIDNINIINNYNGEGKFELSDKQEYLIIHDDKHEKIIRKFFKIVKIEILLKNDNDIAVIIFKNIKYIIYQDSSEYFRIADLYVRDLTDKKWDFILYKNTHNNIFEMSINADTQEGEKIYSLEMNLANIVVNIDEFCLKLMVPIIQQSTDVIGNILEFFPNNSIFLKDCYIRENIVIISYKPRKINLGNIIKGKTDELLNIGTINDFKIEFKDIHITNIFSLSELAYNILQKWKRDLSDNAILLLCKNDKLNMFLFPLLRLNNFSKEGSSNSENIKNYLKDVSNDFLEIIRKSINRLENILIDNNNIRSRNLLSESLLTLQCIVDNRKKDNYDKKYKN